MEETTLAKKVKSYTEQWDKDKSTREKEIAERKEESIFDEPDPKERGLLTHPINPLSERHPHFKSLTLHQVTKIEECVQAGLSIRSIKKALHVFENIDVSYGTIKSIRKLASQSVD